MTLKLKVCGMRSPGNIEELIEQAAPDFMGLIFYPRSPRYAEGFLSGSFTASLTKNVKKVGVFVNESPERIAETTRKYGIDHIQLHGSESPGICQRLKEKGFTVIKAWPVDANADFARLQEYKPAVDYFLFDRKTPAHGGSGQTFDWRILRKYDNEKPFFLSGGIEAKHIDDIAALMDMNIYAVDINSRFEAKPGEKEIDKVKQFAEKLRNIKTLYK